MRVDFTDDAVLSPDPGGQLVLTAVGPRGDVPRDSGAVRSDAATAGPQGDGSAPSGGDAQVGPEDRSGVERGGRAEKVIAFEVLGTPAPKGSSRAMVNPKTGRAMNVPSGSDANRDRLRNWDSAIREVARDTVGDVTAPPFIRVPLVFHVEFRLARPAGHYSKTTGNLLPSAPKYPIGKPDGDKLARQAADSLATIVFDDDSRIVSWQIDKVYAKPGNEGAVFTVREAR